MTRKNPKPPLQVPRRVTSQSSSSKQLYYAIAKGRYTGIFKGFNKCKQYIDDCKGAVVRSFSTYQKAAEYIRRILNDRITANQSDSICKRRTFADVDNHISIVNDADRIPHSTAEAVDRQLMNSSLCHSYKVYAVAVGRKPGIYSSYDEVVLQTSCYLGSVWKGFEFAAEAEQFLAEYDAELKTRREERRKRIEEEKEKKEKHIRWLKDPRPLFEVPCNSFPSQLSLQQVYYAVAKGRYTGIFKGWNKCKQYIDDCNDVVFRSFSTFQEAAEYIQLGIIDQSTHNHDQNISRKRKFAVINDHNTIIHDDDIALNFTSQAIDPKLDSLLPSCQVYEAAVDRRTSGTTSSYDELVQQTRGYIGSAWTGFEPAIEAENYLGREWTTGREERGKRTDEEKDEINKEHTTWLKDHAEDLRIRIQQRQEKKRMAKESKNYLMEEAMRRKKFRHEKKLINAREKKERLLNVKQSKKIFLKEWSKLTAPRPLGSHYDLSFLAMLYFDGGCRTLSGIAGAGSYLRVVRSITTVEIPVVTIHRVRWYSDESAGSMDAEYHGLLQGLKMLHSLLQEFWQAIRSDDTDAYSSQLANKAPTVRIQVYGDALNIIENMADNKAVPNPKLEAIHTSCMDIVRTIQHDHVEIQFHHIYRQYNEIADGLANEAMDERRSWTTIENTIT